MDTVQKLAIQKHILISPQLRKHGKRRQPPNSKLPSLAAAQTDLHPGEGPTRKSCAEMPKIFTIGESDIEASAWTGSQSAGSLLSAHSGNGLGHDTLSLLLGHGDSTSGEKSPLNSPKHDRRSAVRTPNVLLGQVSRQALALHGQSPSNNSTSPLKTLHEDRPVRVELDEESGEHIVAAWAASYDKEKAAFGSVAVFAEVRLKEAIADLQREGKSRPVKALAAICADLLCKLAGLFGRYGDLMKTLTDQILRCLFVEYDEVLSSHVHLHKCTHSAPEITVKDFFSMTPWFSLVADESHIKKTKDRMHLHLTSETKGAVARLAQAEFFLRNACFLVWKKLSQQNVFLIRMMRRRELRRIVHAMSDWVSFKKRAPRLFKQKMWFKRWQNRRPKNLVCTNRQNSDCSNFSIGYNHIQYYEQPKTEEGEKRALLMSIEQDQMLALRMVDTLDAMIHGQTHGDIMTVLEGIFKDQRLLEYIISKVAIEPVESSMDPTKEDYKNFQKEVEEHKSTVTKHKLVMGVMRAMGQNKKLVKVQTSEASVQTPSEWSGIDVFNQRQRKKKNNHSKAKVAMLLDQLEVQKAPPLPTRTCFELIPSFYEEHLMRHALYKKAVSSDTESTATTDDDSAPEPVKVEMKAGDRVAQRRIARVEPKSTAVELKRLQTMNPTGIKKESTGSGTGPEAKPFHQFVRECLIRRFGIKALATKYQRGLIQTMQKEMDVNPRFRVFAFLHGVQDERGELEVPDAHRTFFFLNLIREIFDSPKQICAVMNSKNQHIDRDRLIEGVRRAFHQVAENEPEELDGMIAAINRIPVEAVIHGKEFKINIDTALDVLRGFWRTELHIVGAQEAKSEAARIIQRFMRRANIRIQTKKTQLVKLEEVFEELDHLLHQNSGTGVFTFNEFKQLLQRLGYPNLTEKLQLQLFDEWHNKADWLDTHEKALKTRPTQLEAVLSPDQKAMFEKLSAAVSKEKTNQHTNRHRNSAAGAGQHTTSKAWKGALLYARYGFLWQDFSKKDREMAQNCEARRGVKISQRAFALTMLDKGFYIIF